uniref:Uncharacterized protein n=1 Tax=Arundo donax TaxID=35708 RepID=A0A0A9B0L4_ARUDO
MATALWFSSF